MKEVAFDVTRIDDQLAAILPDGALYAVGGRVRDELRARFEGLTVPVKDLDYIVVGVPLDDLLVRLRTIGRAELTGASFSVVKTIIGGVTVDVALPRRERSTGVGHRDFVVESGPNVSLEEDLARRDFRMNMLARCIRPGNVHLSELVDPYQGAQDVFLRQIDLLRAEAFVEDPLRMLRAIQFAARFTYTVTPTTLEAMRTSASLVSTISPERVRDELVKLLEAQRPSIGIELMRQTGLLKYVLPEVLEGYGVDQNIWHAYDVYRHNWETLDAASPDDPVLRLAALLHDIAKPRTKDGPHFYRHEIVGATMAGEVLKRLRFSAATIEVITGLVREHMYVANPEMAPSALRRFVRRVGVENLKRQFALRRADILGSGLPERDNANERFEARVAEIIAERPAFSIKDLVIDGNDVIAALVEAGRLPEGSRGGAVVGHVLQAVFERVTEVPSLNERTHLVAIVDEIVARIPIGSNVPP